MHDWVDIPNPDYGRETVYGDKDKKILAHHRRPRDLQPDLARRRSASSTSPVAKKQARRHDPATPTRSPATAVTVETLDQLKELGFTDRLPGRHLDRDRRHDHPGVEEGDRRRRPRRKIAEVEAQYQQGHHHRRRALQQGRRHLDQRHGPHRQGGLRQARAQRGQDRGQPRLHHDGLRRPRQQAAGPPALRRARPHGQALRRNHRAPHPLLVPRGPHGARVLHLHPRRPQGPRRHRPQDGRRRLPDAQALRRGAWTSSSPRTIAAPATASGRRRSIEGDDEIVEPQASASSAAARATTSRTR